LTPNGEVSGSKWILDRAHRGFDGRSQVMPLVQVFEIMPAPLGCPDLLVCESEQAAQVSFLRLGAAAYILMERTSCTNLRGKTSL